MTAKEKEYDVYAVLPRSASVCAEGGLSHTGMVEKALACANEAVSHTAKQNSGRGKERLGHLLDLKVQEH